MEMVIHQKKHQNNISNVSNYKQSKEAHSEDFYTTYN